MLFRQKRALITDFNRDNFKKPTFENAILLFERQVKKTPQNIAVEFGKEKLTYEELNQKVNVSASFLTNFLNKNQQKIYILVDEGIDAVVAFLAILKSGNILIPINPRHPPETIKIMLEEIKPDFIIIQRKYFNFFKEINKNSVGIKVLIIDGDSKINYPKVKFKLLTLDDVNRLSDKVQTKKIFKNQENKYASIYFTSGSTGRPKGVLLTNLSLSYKTEYSFRNSFKKSFKNKKFLKNNFRVGQNFPIYSQLSLTKDILPTLCSGATLCISRDKDLLSNISKLIKWLKENRITLIHFPSGYTFKYFMNAVKKVSQLKYLKYITFSGVKLISDEYLKRFFEKFGSRIKLSSGYGTTEAPLGFEYELSKSDLKENLYQLANQSAQKPSF